MADGLSTQTSTTNVKRKRVSVCGEGLKEGSETSERIGQKIWTSVCAQKGMVWGKREIGRTI